MNLKAILENAAQRTDLRQELVTNVWPSIKAKDTERSHRILLEYVNKHPNEDYNWVGSLGGNKIKCLHLSVFANDYEICKYMLEKGAKPDSFNICIACKNGNIELVKLLIGKFGIPTDNDISQWKQYAMIGGREEITHYLSDLNRELYIRFSKRNTDYFIRVLSNSIKYTPINCYSVNKQVSHRPKREIMQEMLDCFNDRGYIAYTIENLMILKEAIEYYISISKLFHREAENTIRSAIDYYRSYKDGITTTDKRTFDGALLVSI